MRNQISTCRLESPRVPAAVALVKRDDERHGAPQRGAGFTAAAILPRQLEEQILSLRREVEARDSELETLQRRRARENQEGAHLIAMLRADAGLAHGQRSVAPPPRRGVPGRAPCRTSLATCQGRRRQECGWHLDCCSPVPADRL